MTHDYDGPIEPGMTFVWEPLKPHACLHVQVTRVEGEMLWTRSWVKHSRVNGAYEGEETWNEVGRVREAVMLTDHIIGPYYPEMPNRYADGYPFDTSTL